MRKNINVVKINNSKDIDTREKNERNISPPLKINYIYRKKEWKIINIFLFNVID